MAAPEAENDVTAYLDRFLARLQESLAAENFVKLTFSKPVKAAGDLQNVFARPVMIRDQRHLSFTFRYKTNDQVHNHLPASAEAAVRELIPAFFKIATLFTLEEDLILEISKRGKVSWRKTKPAFSAKPPETHDRQKIKRAESGAYLHLLGITDASGAIIPKMAAKFRQINKYLEIIEGLVKTSPLPKKINVVDMGCGKGYLTFALYDFLVNKLHLDAHVTGVELRPDLVAFCNDAAGTCGFEHLQFEQQSIGDYNGGPVDILIALHACDTATDDAIKKGIDAGAGLIITAPCCHKQIRQQIERKEQVEGKELDDPLMKYGIFRERQLEMVTDTLRALLMEQYQYRTRIFEFISNEHTRKNVMLVGQKQAKQADTVDLAAKISAIKEKYGIEKHYLETKLKS
jgi:hypothetical protein